MTTLEKPVLIPLGIVGAYLVPAEGGCVLVDTGVAKQQDRIFAAMAEQGLAPESIRLIFITHAHGDHIGSLKAVVEACHAPVLVRAIEAPAVASGEPVLPGGITFAGWVLSKLVRLLVRVTPGQPVKPDVEIQDEMRLEAYGVKGRAIHTPGHTSGSLTLLLDTGDAFVGDLVTKTPVFPGGSYVPMFGDSREAVYASWRRLLDAGATLFYSDHIREPVPAEVLKAELARAGKL